MKIKLAITLLFVLLLATVSAPRLTYAISWETDVDLFQITTNGSQQSSPSMYRNFVIWTDWRGGADTSLDVYGYNLRKAEEMPLIVREGQQWAVGYNGRYIIYNQYFDASDPKSYDVRAYDVRRDRDYAITDENGSQSATDVYGNTVVYLDGGACGKLYAYDLRRKRHKLLTDEACTPVRIWGNVVVWNYAAPNGTNVYGYDLRRNRQLDIATDDGFQESPNIYRYNVVWLHRDGDYYAIYMRNLRTGREKLLHETSEYYINYPAVSKDYVIWGKSHNQHFAGVEGIDLKTGELFEVQEEGSHQNTNLEPAIWDDVAVWKAWRTGNGDIYGTEIGR